MASFIEKSSSSRRRTTPLIQGGVVIAYDAMKNPNFEEFKEIITDVLSQEDMIQESGTIVLLGVVDKALHPMGFQIQIGPKSFIGAHVRAIKEEVSRKVDDCVRKLKRSAEECEDKGVDVKVKISVGVPTYNVLVEEVIAMQATWAVLDRPFRKDLRFFLKHIPCKIAHVRDNLTLKPLRSYYIDLSIESMKHKLFYSLCKPVPLPPSENTESDTETITSVRVSPLRTSDIPSCGAFLSPISPSKENITLLHDETGSKLQQKVSGNQKELENKSDGSLQVMQEEIDQQSQSEAAVLSAADTMKTRSEAVGSNYSEIQIEPGTDAKEENKSDGSPEEKKSQTYFNISDLCCADKINMDLNSLGCSFSSIHNATDNFSCHNFLGEDDYGVVYKGKLNDGKLIAVKVQTEANTQKLAEFHSEVQTLSFARHSNIVTLLGYCFQENLKILIYEYTSNKSLEWHLFDNTEKVLDWNQRRNIAIGTAAGLRYLHEECHGYPIIHRDVRPANIIVTHDFVPLLGDFGLAKWKTHKFDKQRKIPENLVYIAPECVENGICSLKTDVYAFGILLIQLISGRTAVDTTIDDHQQSIRQWALALIQSHALHDLVDPRIGDTYCAYDLYNMARAAYFCVQTKPTLRPTMGEVLCLLEGTNDHLRHVNSNLYPVITT